MIPCVTIEWWEYGWSLCSIRIIDSNRRPFPRSPSKCGDNSVSYLRPISRRSRADVRSASAIVTPLDVLQLPVSWGQKRDGLSSSPLFLSLERKKRRGGKRKDRKIEEPKRDRTGRDSDYLCDFFARASERDGAQKDEERPIAARLKREKEETINRWPLTSRLTRQGYNRREGSGKEATEVGRTLGIGRPDRSSVVSVKPYNCAGDRPVMNDRPRSMKDEFRRAICN